MIIVYHANCADGFGAAWAAWKLFGGDAIYIPSSYGQPVPDAIHPTNRLDRVCILDFSYPRDVLLGLKPRQLDDQPGWVGGSTWDVKVIDHHKTAKADLEGLPFCTFDMGHSGAYLAWKYFHPTTPVPRLIEYIEDRDLWLHKLPHSKAVNAWIHSHPLDFMTWNKMASLLEAGYDEYQRIVTEGEAILRFKQQQVNIICDQAWIGWIGGHKVPIAATSAFFSEVGEELCRRYPDSPFSASYLDRADGFRQFGLRSRGGFDVSEVAKQYGGGGHPAAAGFQERVGRYHGVPGDQKLA